VARPPSPKTDPSLSAGARPLLLARLLLLVRLLLPRALLVRRVLREVKLQDLSHQAKRRVSKI
jgi:hypothetical protein